MYLTVENQALVGFDVLKGRDESVDVRGRRTALRDISIPTLLHIKSIALWWSHSEKRC
jgi:hypothetical protein